MERIFYFIATIFLLNLRLAWAFNTSFTPPTQCGPFTVTWNATADTQTGPPYKLLIIPVNAPSAPSANSTGLGPQLSLPIVTDIPDTAWNAATTSGTYTIEQLQLRNGEHFIIVMDDGFGLGTGGVSQIQTVENGDAGGSAPSCIPSDQANANVNFSLSTLQPQQCSSLTINVNSPKAVRGFVPGGTPFGLDLPASTTGNTTVEWTVNVQAGTDFVLLYEGQNGDVASSGLLQSGPASGSSGGNCVANGPHTTGIPIPSFVPNPSSGSTSSGHGTATAAPSSSTTSTSSSRSNSIDMSILAGGAVVGFALLGRTDLSLLTIGLSFLARLQLVDAFSTSFTSATSCGAFTVNWNATAEQSIGPPFSLLIVPVNSPDAPADSSAARGPGSLSPPIRREIPESAWNAASRSGSYTIDQLPLQAGERFIVVMDDGFGYGTGGVSLIHRVETSGSSPTSCIPSSPANGNVYFAISSLNPAQCSPLTILVNSPIEIRGFIPGGSPFSLDMPASTSGNVTVSWNVNVATGSSFVLLYRAQNGDIATSGLMETTAAGQFGDGCMSNAPHSTITSSSSQTNGAQVTTTSSGSKKISIPALVGGIIGGLGFLAAVALITFFVIIRRTDSMGRSRSVSTASGFKGRSYDFNTTNSNDRSSTGGASAGYQNIGKNKKEEGLEGRFGGKLFGGGKKKGGNASGSGGNMRTYTSSQRRAIYPGLSIASTQNRSIGLVTLDEPTHDVQMNPMPTMHQPSNPKTGHNDSNGRHPAVERIQNEAMSVSTDITGYTGRDSISISNAHQSSYSGQPLMTDSGTKNTSSVNDTPSASNPRTNERPSTAPTSGGAPGFHLPSGWRRPSSDGDDVDNPNGGQPRNNVQLHEYPPDDKSAMRSRGSRRTVDRIDESTDILTDDEYVPPVREDIFPSERHEDVTDTEALGSWDRRVVVDHPYATAQSPHVDGYDDASRRIRGASVSHPYSDPLNSSSGSYPPTSFSSNRDRNDRRPNSRRRGVEESPTIIRHTDAGRFGLDDDDESQESGRRRRVVELPPAYGEFSEGRGGRSRERA